MEFIKKKCQFCSFVTALIYKNKDNYTCPVCTNETTNITEMIKIEDENFYHFCNKCKILFRHNEENVHHLLDNYGKIYYADLIKKYTIDNQIFDQMPTFMAYDKCVYLINNDLITFEWENLLKHDDCCTCYEPTTTFTECNHPLCKNCRANIKDTKCPICREKQQYKQVDYNDNNNNNNVDNVTFEAVIYDNDANSNNNDDNSDY